MKGKGKITITEIFLLLSTVVFLVLAVSVHLWNMRGEPDIWSVRTQKTVMDDSLAIQQININTADAQQLQRLDGIGPVLAQRIVEWRTAHGAFTSVEELLEIEGIGNATLENLRDMIIIGDTK
ncbi:MAG: helix-hairpin-helix domain-containing protein [Oscillospiraceae bacterium]|nr:helix-hairpin-helix domain-containing protein [Oscillospiraceae bacterium]